MTVKLFYAECTGGPDEIERVGAMLRNAFGTAGQTVTVTAVPGATAAAPSVPLITTTHPPAAEDYLPLRRSGNKPGRKPRKATGGKPGRPRKYEFADQAEPSRDPKSFGPDSRDKTDAQLRDAIEKRMEAVGGMTEEEIRAAFKIHHKALPRVMSDSRFRQDDDGQWRID